jgi:hypothetical protein
MKQLDDLLEEFVGCFNASTLVEVSRECGVLGEYEGELVRRQDTPNFALDKLYSELPSRFPLLYERFVLTYRWYRSEVNVLDLFKGCPGQNSFDLFGNPPGESLDGLRTELFRDPALIETCLPHGYIQFASGPNGHYDPICFDTSNKNSDHDFAIVWLDHEEILCNSKIRVIQTIAPSFESLISTAISALRQAKDT